MEIVNPSIGIVKIETGNISLEIVSKNSNREVALNVIQELERVHNVSIS